MNAKGTNALMRNSFFSLARLAALCGLIVCVGDFIVTGILGYFYDGYDLLDMSQSRLGVTGSPMSVYMTVWGFCFSVLFTAFALGLRKTIWKQQSGGSVAAVLIIIYGLGEGIGSGIFPYDHLDGNLTPSGWLHSAFSGMGMTALAALPFIVSRMHPQHVRMRSYALSTGWSGLLLIGLFLLAKAGVLLYKGLWQRLFILDYYLLIIALAVRMAISNPLNTVQRLPRK